jgi:hypothetical protein
MFAYTSNEILTEAKIRMMIFMVTLSWPFGNLLAEYRCFGKHTASISALKIGAICYPETSVLIYQSICPHNSEHHNMNSYFPVEFTSCFHSKLVRNVIRRNQDVFPFLTDLHLPEAVTDTYNKLYTLYGCALYYFYPGSGVHPVSFSMHNNLD